MIKDNLKTFVSAALLATSLVSAQNPTTKCYDLKMFVSRGTGENATYYGVTETLVKGIKRKIDGSDYEAIKYPATDDNPNYFASAANGTRLLKEAMRNYTEACPDSKIALFGYSQGAQITSNIVCGSPAVWAAYGGFADVNAQFDEIIDFASPLPQEDFKNVISVVLFGDTTHRDDAPYNYGNSTGSGIFWRSDISGCKGLGSRIRSYCTAGDPFCDVGKYVNLNAHIKYIEDYGDEVAEYVVDQYKSGGNSSENSTDSPSSTPVPESVGTNIIPSCAFVLIATFAMLWL
ncbi:hypothetical protein FSARC_4033 [Fusarium sarcochroum]|uniref:Cutinase n=1 Tax=Fusarium sarcochroum TaxID=1208366 RepID=A0A8H4U2Q7_9HYPO|nr:hypothetical protein FSARC_4033 [Fusarium sarcochroum]